VAFALHQRAKGLRLHVKRLAWEVPLLINVGLYVSCGLLNVPFQLIYFEIYIAPIVFLSSKGKSQFSTFSNWYFSRKHFSNSLFRSNCIKPFGIAKFWLQYCNSYLQVQQHHHGNVHELLHMHQKVEAKYQWLCKSLNGISGCPLLLCEDKLIQPQTLVFHRYKFFLRICCHK